LELGLRTFISRYGVRDQLLVFFVDVYGVKIIHGGDRKTFEVITSTQPRGALGSVAPLLAATLYQGNPDKNHKLWSIVSTERYILHIIIFFML